MFGKFARKKFINMQVKEAEKFLFNLKTMDSDELGLLVAIAADVRNQYSSNGYNLDDPLTLHTLNPNLVVDMVRQIKVIQKGNHMMLAAANMVWVFSLRAGNSFELRELARRIWGELERGFPFVETSVLEARSMLPSDLNYDGYNQFPIGLSPQPQ